MAERIECGVMSDKRERKPIRWWPAVVIVVLCGAVVAWAQLGDRTGQSRFLFSAQTVVVGLMLLVLWFAALVAWRPGLFQPFATFVGLDLRLDLLRTGEVPGVFHIDAWTVLGLVIALSVWLIANAGTTRRREA